MTAKKRQAAKRGADAPADDPGTDFDFAAHEQRLQAIRELQDAEVFRVFADTSDPSKVAEYLVRIDREGVTIRESHKDAPVANDEHLLDWYCVHHFAGGAADHMREIERDTHAVISELETWETIRDGEARRIQRAREIQRTQHVRQLCDRAAAVLACWERPRVATKTASTWRELTARRNARPRL